MLLVMVAENGVMLGDRVAQQVFLTRMDRGIDALKDGRIGILWRGACSEEEPDRRRKTDANRPVEIGKPICKLNAPSRHECINRRHPN